MQVSGVVAGFVDNIAVLRVWAGAVYTLFRSFLLVTMLFSGLFLRVSLIFFHVSFVLDVV